MSAPNTPVATAAPRLRSASTNRSCRGCASGPACTRSNDGRRPLRQSACSVKLGTTSTPPPTSSTERFSLPASSSKIRRLATLSASLSASASVSPTATPT